MRLQPLALMSILAAATAVAEAPMNIPHTPLWGDTHLHTSASGDAVIFGGSISAEKAYRFARGETVTARSGQPAQLHRPLDFLVIADHAEAFGMFTRLDHPLLAGDKDLQDMVAKSKESPAKGMKIMGKLIADIGNGVGPAALQNPANIKQISGEAWDEYTALAERFNEPGVFTALVGYEWSSHPGGDNLHRVVVYKEGADKAKQMLPFSSMQSQNPQDLWHWMDRYEEKTGGSLLAIPHNSNLSGGKMFPQAAVAEEYSDTYLATRKRREHVVEITQIKGDSESHPVLSPNDEFAGFGDNGWDNGNLPLTNLETDAMKGGEYIREALKQGLAYEKARGINPYQFGVIGSTDAHTGLSAVEEDNFWGKHSGNEPGPGRLKQVTRRNPRDPETFRLGWQYQSGGYAAVWAHENTRASIFDALQRREVYATTGSRITLRVFAGEGLQTQWLDSEQGLQHAYQHAVPMGGEISAAKVKRAPQLLIRADKDPMGANLDRIQVVKGWLDQEGELHEQVFDVAWSQADVRKLDDNGKVPAVGSTVDIATPSYTNDIGDTQLTALWTDPAFDAAQAAFYYARVIEIPTPNWVAYDAARFNVEAPEGAITSHQERAYSSAIWYRP